MKKAALFLATQKGYDSLCYLIEQNQTELIGCVVSFHELDVEKSYDSLLEAECHFHNIPYYQWKDCKDHLHILIYEHEILCAIAIGWRFIIPLDINEDMDYPLMVFHDSLLPKYRGFAPTPTAMLCGEKEIGVTILVATEAMDEGDIIRQERLLISENDYVKEVIKRQSGLYGSMLSELLRSIQVEEVSTTPQNQQQATYSVWRDMIDCHIDWSKSATEIYALIRAVSSPYLGAYFFLNNKKLVVNRAIIEKDINFAIRDCGKIWSLDSGMPTVICGKGLIKLLDTVDEDGNVVAFSKLRDRFC